MKTLDVFPSDHPFFRYSKRLFEEWGMRVFLAADALGLLAESFNIDFPSILFLIIGTAGFVLAGYRIYLSMLPAEEIIKPKLEINFIEGNEYAYELLPLSKLERDAYEGNHEILPLSRHEITQIEAKLIVPECRLTINIRLTNVYPLECRILSITGRTDILKGSSLKDERLRILLSLTHFPIEGIEKLSYPIILERKNEIAPYTFRGILRTDSLTPAQFASRLALISHDTKDTFYVTAEVQSLGGEIIVFENSIDVSFYPLKELYATHWQSIERDELLRVLNV